MNILNILFGVIFTLLFVAVALIVIVGLTNGLKLQMNKISRKYDLKSLEDLGEISSTLKPLKLQSSRLYKGTTNTSNMYFSITKTSGAKGLGSYYKYEIVSETRAKELLKDIPSIS